MKQIIAYCWADGTIELGPICPDGAFSLVRDSAPKVRHAVETLSTHAYDGVTYLVPKSIAWCEGDMDAAVADVMRFIKDLEMFLEDMVDLYDEVPE